MNPKKPNLLAVARLTGLFGVSGALKCRPSSAGEEAIVANREFFLDPEGSRSVVPTLVRRHHTRIIVRLRGVETVEAARPFAGATLYLPREQISLREGEYLDEDLIGSRIVDLWGRELGTVSEVAHYPAQTCLVVEPGRALLPLVRAFIQNIDIAARRITVTLPEGLLDHEKAEEA